MKNSIVERFLYLVLLLVFLALSVAGFFLYSLTKENQRIAKQNRSYSRCIATVFAQYTHDFVPVTITNLDKCTLQGQAKTINNTPPSGTPPAATNNVVNYTTTPQSVAQEPTKTTTTNNNTNPPTASNQNPTQPPNSHPVTPEPIRVLGVPVCAPDPLGLIKRGLCVTH